MSGQEREVPIEAVGAVVLYLQECRRAKIKPSESEIARVAVYAADTARAALAAREEPLTVWTCMSCGHISDGQSCRACGSEAMPERWVREAPTDRKSVVLGK